MRTFLNNPCIWSFIQLLPTQSYIKTNKGKFTPEAIYFFVNGSSCDYKAPLVANADLKKEKKKSFRHIGIQLLDFVSPYPQEGSVLVRTIDWKIKGE